MSFELETAAEPENLRRVVIDPLTRVEGHGKVTILLDDENRVHQVRLHIVEFRGFEKFIQGRPYWEVPVVVQRLCGICPVSHHLAAAKAIDMLVGAKQLTPTAEALRRLMHYGQVLQSHALHFFHLASPDLLFGFDSDVAKRNIVSVAEAYPEIARQGVFLRKFGQEVIRLTAGKRIHGTGAIPGGMNKNLSRDERDFLLKDMPTVLSASRAALELIKKLFFANAEFNGRFAYFKSNSLGLVAADGALELYHGGLRAKDAEGQTIFDHADSFHYNDYINEEVKSWSYMKFPFLVPLGQELGWYKVGPLARVNNCDYISTPLAEAGRREFLAYGGGHPIHSPLASHWARMMEMLHCAERIEGILQHDEVLGSDLVAGGEKTLEGVGVIEAPRGTLFHHYRIDEDDLVTMANLIVSTTSNNQAMNEAVRQVAKHHLDGHQVSEALLNHIEVAIRAFDPCLSCATHALGKMPLMVEVLDCEGRLLDRVYKAADRGVASLMG